MLGPVRMYVDGTFAMSRSWATLTVVVNVTVDVVAPPTVTVVVVMFPTIEKSVVKMMVVDVDVWIVVVV